MGNILIPGNPECPLCLKRMREVYDKHGKLFVCTGINCMISIRAADPAINNWKLKTPPDCTICGKPMRAFFRVLDRFLKCQCPHCLAKGKLVQVTRGEVKHMDPRWSVDTN
jgi:hypothetical protein